IDTGKLMSEFRRRERSTREEAAALQLAKHYGALERSARAGLHAARAAAGIVGEGALASIPTPLRLRVSSELIPVLPKQIPPAASARMAQTRREGAAGVYLPACINRIFANPSGLT